MNYQILIERITAKTADEPAVRALFLGGSYGRGTTDAYSDVDLIALVEADAQAGVVVKWRRILPEITPVVFWNQQGRGNVLLNAITEDWLRCDLVIMPPAAFIGRARDTVKPLIDRDGIYETLPASLPPKQPNVERVRYLINEFIRILGLLSVGAGRGEYYTLVTGTCLLRDHLTALMLEEVTLPDPGGALHLSKLLPPEQMEILKALPLPKPNRAEVIAAHFEIARVFFPRARALGTRLGIEWPSAFEVATRRLLAKHFGDESLVGW